jgi:hypothetical protein
MNTYSTHHDPSPEDLALQASPTFQMLHRHWTGLAPVPRAELVSKVSNEGHREP